MSLVILPKCNLYFYSTISFGNFKQHCRYLCQSVCDTFHNYERDLCRVFFSVKELTFCEIGRCFVSHPSSFLLFVSFPETTWRRPSLSAEAPQRLLARHQSSPYGKLSHLCSQPSIYKRGGNKKTTLSAERETELLVSVFSG